jgi:type II secretory pathway pseudopilin PulG
MMRPGDTLVEVLLATVVLSIVLAGAFSLSNKAIQIGQSSIERTEAINLVRDYAETLRFIHATDAAGYGQTWENIVDVASSSSPSYLDNQYCDISLSSSPIYFDFEQFVAATGDTTQIVKNFNSIPETGGRLQYADATDNNADDIFAVWLEVYDPNPGVESVLDIHIRACWDNISGSNVNRVGSVVRLSETRDI